MYVEDGGVGTVSDPEIATLIVSVRRLSGADRRHVSALVESLLRGAPGRDARPGSDSA
ncbi:hypothetical protein [Streptomyces sp. NPDC001978]|uniref:hypothetical protein n=1 Tax=Streptomyces sp. NPDC001978 TaxID=3364627 RepID=UPI0036D0211D